MEHGEQDFYRPHREASDATEDDLARQKRFTDAVAANIRLIREDCTDLSALAQRLANLAQALVLIREYSAELDLEQLERRVASIVSALKIIEADAVVKELDQAS
jgi:uncharacterized protein with HEPN domain